MFTEEDLRAYKAKDNAQKAERERVKKEMVIKVIEANNKLHSIVKNFQDYVGINYEQLIGKKIFLTDGSRSKVFNKFFDSWKKTIELTQYDFVYFSKSYGSSTNLNISLNVRGGQIRENNEFEVDTTYYKNIENTIWDIIKIDKNYIYNGYDMSERFSKDFDYNSYLEASKNIAEIREQIKKFEIIISEQNKNIPPQLI